VTQTNFGGRFTAVRSRQEQTIMHAASSYTLPARRISGARSNAERRVLRLNGITDEDENEHNTTSEISGTIELPRPARRDAPRAPNTIQFDNQSVIWCDTDYDVALETTAVSSIELPP
jgi:hypothetical protein